MNENDKKRIKHIEELASKICDVCVDYSYPETMTALQMTVTSYTFELIKNNKRASETYEALIRDFYETVLKNIKIYIEEQSNKE